MIKKEKITKDNIVKFPSKLTDLEKEIEAVIFNNYYDQGLSKNEYSKITCLYSWGWN